jgi:hypothetical protein
MKLSRGSLELLALMFGTNSDIKLPIAVVDLIIEIREAVSHALRESDPNATR